MKIVYNTLGTFNSAGMERTLSNKTNYLVNSGYDVTIITTDQKNRKPFYTLDERVKLIDLSINYTDHTKKSDWKLIQLLFRFYYKKKHKQKLKKILSEIKADIVISMFNHDADFLYKIKDGSKKIIETHFARIIRFTAPRKGLYYILDIYSDYKRTKNVTKYDKFIVLTHEDKNHWGNLPNIEVIPNANSFKCSEAANINSKIAIAVGRYEYQKNFEDLINVWAIVNKKHPDWKLNIFGDGSQKEYLQNMIDNLKLSDVINLSPPTKNIKDEYLKSSMFIMTSRFEGLPMTLLEAQACGLPLVSYDCKCGPKDVIKNNENGFIIEFGDKKKMANKIIQLIEDKDLRKKMSENSSKLSENFSEDKIMSIWINLFNNLLSEKL